MLQGNTEDNSDNTGAIDEQETLIPSSTPLSNGADSFFWSCNIYLIVLGALTLLADLTIKLCEDLPSKPLDKLDHTSIEVMDGILGSAPLALMLLELLFLFLRKKCTSLQPKPNLGERLHQAIVDISNRSGEVETHADVQPDEESAIVNSLDLTELRKINNKLIQKQLNDKSDEKFNSIAIRAFIILRCMGYLFSQFKHEKAAITFIFFADGAYSFLALISKGIHKCCIQSRNYQRYLFFNKPPARIIISNENTGSNRLAINHAQEDQEIISTGARSSAEPPPIDTTHSSGSFMRPTSSSTS